jgi:hypothetical protein
LASSLAAAAAAAAETGSSRAAGAAPSCELQVCACRVCINVEMRCACRVLFLGGRLMLQRMLTRWALPVIRYIRVPHNPALWVARDVAPFVHHRADM